MGRTDERTLLENHPFVPHQYLRETVNQLRYLHTVNTKQRERIVEVSPLCVHVCCCFLNSQHFCGFVVLASSRILESFWKRL